MIPSTFISDSFADDGWFSGIADVRVDDADDSGGVGFESGAKVTFLVDGASTFIGTSAEGGAFKRNVGNGVGNWKKYSLSCRIPES